MALHPSGRSIVVGLTLGGIRRADIKLDKQSGKPILTLSGKDFDDKGSAFGPIKSLSFSSDGRLLALGGEDGTIDIVNWPSLDSYKRWKASEKAIRNLDFSYHHDDGILSSVDESGACILWLVAEAEAISRLQPPPDLPRATFFRCKAAVDEEGIVFFTPVKFKGEGYILKWRQLDSGVLTLEQRSLKPVTPAPICGFDVSSSGRLLVAVTPEGDQCVISSLTLKPVKYRKGAHMTFATAVAFTTDESAIVSTSGDASATLTTIQGSSLGAAGGSVLLVLLALLVAVLAVLLGMLRNSGDAAGAMEAVQWMPQWMQQIVLPSSS